MRKAVIAGAVAVASLVAPSAASAAGSAVSHGPCGVQLVNGGPVYDGSGVTVQTASGFRLSLCRVEVPPPARTVVDTFPGTKGDLALVNRAGKALVVFRGCGPSEPGSPGCG